MRPVQVHRRRGAVRPLAFGAALVVAVSVGVVGGVGTAAHAAPAPVITRTDLPRPDGVVSLGIEGINERGDVVALTATDHEVYDQSVTVWVGGKVSTFGPLGQIYGIGDFNDRGQVLVEPAASTHQLLWDQGQLTELPWPEDKETGRWHSMSWLTDEGHAVLKAMRYDTRYSAYHWAAGRFTRIDPLGSADVTIHGVNRRGQVLISYYLFSEAGAIRHVGLWQNGAVQGITVVPPAGSLQRALLNENGHAVVVTRDRVNGQPVTKEAFRWTAGHRTTIPTQVDDVSRFTDSGQVLGTGGGKTFHWDGGSGPGSVTVMEDRPGLRIEDMNDRGQVVGTWQPADDSGRRLPFLWQDGQYTDLPTLGDKITTAVDINNAGLIVGTGGTNYTVGYARRAILWHGGEAVSLGADNEAVAASAITESGYVLGHTQECCDSNEYQRVGHPVRWRVEVPAGG